MRALNAISSGVLRVGKAHPFQLGKPSDLPLKSPADDAPCFRELSAYCRLVIVGDGATLLRSVVAVVNVPALRRGLVARLRVTTTLTTLPIDGLASYGK